MLLQFLLPFKEYLNKKLFPAFLKQDYNVQAEEFYSTKQYLSRKKKAIWTT